VTARVTTGAVLFVAAIAAVVSYVHIQHLAAVHGQDWWSAHLIPLSIDGTVVAASMVMLRAAHADKAPPWLARFMLGLAVLATLAANIAYGLPFGLPGALISGWPAVAFIGCAEMAIGAVRKMRGASGEPAQFAPADSLDAAIAAMVATTLAGNPHSGRGLATRFAIPEKIALNVRRQVLAAMNGHGPDGGNDDQ